MKYGRLYLIGIILLSLSLCGCDAFDLVFSKDGKPQTKIENTLKTAGDIISNTTGFVPGYGAIGAGVAALLGLIGHSITSVVVSRRNKNALQTVIKGVEIGASEYDAVKNAVLKMFEGKPDVQEMVKAKFGQFTSVKEVIADISKLLGNAPFLDKQVQKITAKM
ncbi:MAG: hypothetical protein AMXMBFR75_33300 [Candidatus Hinthialibacteria bacterium]